MIERGAEPPVQALLQAKHSDLAVGDFVRYRSARGEVQIDEIVERSNSLCRTYFNKTKTLAANINHVFIVAAIEPLFNTIFIDRLLVACADEGIPASLIVNKSDLGTESTQLLVAPYEKLDMEVYWISVLTGEGIEAVEARFQEEDLKTIILTGISGVGKSSLINVLVPDAVRRTDDVSVKTGKGKQTTTQSHAQRYKKGRGSPLYIIDSPGIQHFGLTHLGRDQVESGFPDIWALKSQCEYRNCSHLREEQCAVKEAIAAGTLAESRYLSYLHILEEIDAAREY